MLAFLRCFATALAVLGLGDVLLAFDTIVVDPSGAGDYTTIQEALDNSANGDTIVVLDGVYVEDLIVQTSVTITGSGAGTIVLPATSMPGSGQGSQIATTTWMARIQADDVTISSMVFDGNNPALSAGIDARGGIITDFSVGNFDGLEVLSVTLQNVVYRGIYAAAGGSGHRFVGNTVSNVNQVFLDSVGIFFFGAIGEARNNIVSDCSVGVGFQSGGGGVIAGNSITACDLGILANGSNSPVSIAGNDVSNSAQGIQSIAVNTTVAIDGNETLGCTTGISLFGLGTGSATLDSNTLDGQGLAGSSGVFATTDVSPFGFGDLTFQLTNSVLRDNETGVALSEDLANNFPLLTATLSGSTALYNTFDGSIDFNVLLSDCDDDVDARGNVWGAATAPLIELTLFHQPDDPALGLIDFSEFVNLMLTVDDDGTGDFLTINPAVQALFPGGTITVLPGLYVEDVVVDRSCVIQGAGTDADPSSGTILRGASVDPDLTVVNVTGPDVFLQDLRVDGVQPVHDQARRAIFAANTTGLSVTDCVVHTATTAIAYVNSTNGTFLRNEVFDFGKSLQEGGGIFLLGSNGTIGDDDNGNYAHDGVATGLLFHQSSSGVCRGNRTENLPLGYLSNGANAAVLFERNFAQGCDQGYQSIGNNAAVTYNENDALFCDTGFTLFGLGGQLHTYTQNCSTGNFNSASHGMFFTTESVFGDDDVNAVVSGNSLTGADNGIELYESASSVVFLMNVDLGGGAPNFIADNVGQDLLLTLCDDDIDATGNYFGSTSPGVVETKVFHQVDDPLLGFVTFTGLRPAMTYCKAKRASVGCLPSVSFSGTPSASSASPFLVSANNVINNKAGLLLYGISGGTAFPFQGGTLCVDPPFKRGLGGQSGGNPPPNDCSGVLTFDLNAYIQSGVDPNLVVGQQVSGQFVYRDPGSGTGFGFSNAIQFIIGL